MIDGRDCHSGLLTALFPDQPRHAECARILVGREGKNGSGASAVLD